MFKNFTKYCLTHGATIIPLLIDSNKTNHSGLCNPSVFIDNDNIKIIVRNVNYTLWNCEDEYKLTTPYGPLCYITNINDFTLSTRNFLCTLNNDNLEYKLINTSSFDTTPQWEFVGLEDARLVRWDNKLYATGVRRDVKSDGQGRMELSELDNDGNEISRIRIKAPGDDISYCEKNWMPIIDMPFHYVKWCNPLEIVKVNPQNGDCETVLIKENIDCENLNIDGMSIRGSSQVISYKNYHIAITHLCKLWFNEKNEKSGSGYFEQFIVWDNDWNLVKITEPFSFANFGVEFTNGLAFCNDKFYIPFALQDNFSFMLCVDDNIVHDFIFNDNRDFGNFDLSNNLLLKFFDNTEDSYVCTALGQEYYKYGHFAASTTLFERACEKNTFLLSDELYEALFMCGKSLQSFTDTGTHEQSLWLRMIDLKPNRSEGYIMLSDYYYRHNCYCEAYTMAKIGYNKNYYCFHKNVLDYIDGMIQYGICMYHTENYMKCEDFLLNLLHITTNKRHLDKINNMLSYIYNNKQNRVRVL